MRRTLKRRNQAVGKARLVHPNGQLGIRLRMEDVLELYTEPYDPIHPIDCLF